jgi:hypothetical protein
VGYFIEVSVDVEAVRASWAVMKHLLKGFEKTIFKMTVDSH